MMYLSTKNFSHPSPVGARVSLTHSQWYFILIWFFEEIQIFPIFLEKFGDSLSHKHVFHQGFKSFTPNLQIYRVLLLHRRESNRHKIWHMPSGHVQNFMLIKCLWTHWDWDKMAATLADDIFKCIFLNENVWILINISLKFVPKGSN